MTNVRVGVSSTVALFFLSVFALPSVASGADAQKSLDWLLRQQREDGSCRRETPHHQ